MTSQINPANINGAYPVAGQDNNSQGFRDNFTNTSTNFGYAAAEITDLQNKAILKQALNGGSLNNNMLGSSLSNAVLSDMAYAYTQVALTGNVTIDYSAAQYWSVVAGGNITLQFTNWPAAGNAGVVVVQVSISNTSYTVTLPVAVSVNNAGIQGATVSGSGTTIEFATTGVYTFTFSTVNSGTTITVNESNKQLQAFNASSEVWSGGAGALINLGVTTTIFNGSATATLGDGVSGQVVVFALSTAGTVVITANSPSWSGAGDITLNNQGETATFMYQGTSWFCIGGNGYALS